MVRAETLLRFRNAIFYATFDQDAAFRCAVPRLLLGYPRCAFDSGSIQKPLGAHGPALTSGSAR